jgi:hypothetical protein
MTDFTRIVPVMSCLECWPRMCRCKCPHDVFLNMPCAQCGREDEDNTTKAA